MTPRLPQHLQVPGQVLHARRPARAGQGSLPPLPGAGARRVRRRVHQEHRAMIPAPARAAPALLALAGSCGWRGCKVDKEAFHHRLYSCNPNAANPACGTDIDDQPMACVPAYQLGGRNFCATGCDAVTEPAETADRGHLPVLGPAQRRGRVGRAAAPLQPRRRPGSCNHAGADLPAHRPDRRRGRVHDRQLLRRRQRLPRSGALEVHGRAAARDLRRQERAEGRPHLLPAGRLQGPGTACSPGETCLRDVIPRTSYPPDICVPNCDANGNCPPNYFCYPELYSKASPAVCMPGLLGLRCRTRLDCLFGDCVETAAPLQGLLGRLHQRRRLREVRQHPGDVLLQRARRYCAGARAFRGSQCFTQDGLPLPGRDLRAAHHRQPATGSACRPARRRHLPAYGGVPHACRPQVGRRRRRRSR